MKLARNWFHPQSLCYALAKLSLCVAFQIAFLNAQEQRCVSCHPAQVASYAKSPMAHSISLSGEQPNGRFRHLASRSEVEVLRTLDGRMSHRVTADAITAEYPIAYTVGAGKIGFSYLVSIPPFLYQSPASFYAQDRLWEVSPGYETSRVLDFTRPILGGCLFCHANSVPTLADTENQFKDAKLTPISCERCHGDPTAHLADPTSGTIVNPRKLAPSSRDSICEQCHLEGEARVLNPGNHWQDFHPGADTESVFSTYVLKSERNSTRKAVSQVEQLSLSRCARESQGKLWCGTCHNPHTDPINHSTEVRDSCFKCHATYISQKKHNADSDCVSCHMPRVRPTNISHAAVTSHLITIPRREMSDSKPDQVSLTPWRKPPSALASRNLGLALFEIGSNLQDVSQISDSYELLAKVLPRDPLVETTLGSILLAQKRPSIALELLKRAASEEPFNARYAYDLGVALDSEGLTSQGVAELRRSIRLDKSLRAAYEKLIDIYTRLDMKSQGDEVVREYLRFKPQDIQMLRLAKERREGSRQ